eukprot:361497-Chlamydomonas_euryale.AAC.8
MVMLPNAAAAAGPVTTHRVGNAPRPAALLPSPPPLCRCTSCPSAQPRSARGARLWPCALRRRTHRSMRRL